LIGTGTAAVVLLLWMSSTLGGCGPGQSVAHADTTHTRGLEPTSPDSDSVAVAISSGAITPQEIALGDSIFHGRVANGGCYVCHGHDARGTGVAPNLTDAEWINGDGTMGFIKGTMIQGVQHPQQYPLPMPAFGHSFTDRQLQALTAYVWAVSHRGQRVVPSP
jgi:mono/diheme cytochrome c family protein